MKERASEAQGWIPLGPSWNDAGKSERRKVLREACRLLFRDLRLNGGLLYSMLLEIHADWYTSEGKVLRRDLTNLLKIMEDEVTRALGLDDSHNFEIVVRKYQDTKNEGAAWVHLRALNPATCPWPIR